VSTRLEVVGVDGMPEVAPGDDLAALVHAAAPPLADGDVVVVTSKVVSKAEGRVLVGDRLAAIEAETVRVVARRGPTTIARTRHGLTLAAAGVDESNVEPGHVVLLPADPDASARRLRARLRELSGHDVAVVVSDTAGRPWREGQTDLAVGCAGLPPLEDHAGRRDAHGNPLSVTAPAVADEVAAAGDLVMGKVTGRPAAVVRGLADRVLADDGPGAASLVRDEAGDMFVLGAYEAVVAAVCRDDEPALAALRRSAPPAAGDPARHLIERADGPGTALRTTPLDDGSTEVHGPDDLPTAAALERVCALAAVHRWQVVADERNLGRCRIVLRADKTTP
jgi:coenzyme F420-0:L-glutamate ligase / coenzyme F420-1:gamma-L-glutamate ligase